MTRAVQDGRRQGGLAAADCDTSHHVALRRLETACFERKVIGAELTFPGQTLRKGGTEDDAAVQDGRRCGSGLAAANDCDTRHFRRVRFSGNGRLGEEGREARKLFSCDRSCGKGGTEDDVGSVIQQAIRGRTCRRK